MSVTVPPGLDAFLAAAMVTLPVGLACAALGRRLGVVAWPRKDRWHARPVPLLGGVAVAAGLAAGAMVTGDLPPRLTGLLALALVAGALGLGDDLSSLSPAARLAVETALAVGLVVLGLRLPLTSWAPIDALLAVLFVVAVTNAFNLIDNMDGLAAGVALVAATCRWALLAGEGDGAGAGVAAALAGAALGFWLLNRPPARLFLGDAGSLLIGFLVSGLCLTPAGGPPRGPAGWLVPLGLTVVPLFDTAFVVATRLLEGRPATRGGRDHTSHRLAEIGLGEGGAVALLVGAAVLAGLPLLAAQVLGWAVAATLLGLVVLALAGLGWGLTRVGTQGRVP